MAFNERLKEKRSEVGLKQVELAKLVGVSDRTIQKYESGESTPRNVEIVQKLAHALHTTYDYLMDTKESIVVEAHEKGGAKAAREIDELVSQVSGLFAGGTLDATAMDGAMRALNDAYWDAKEKNKEKYTPKKYKK